jgi:hypothetical protein
MVTLLMLLFCSGPSAAGTSLDKTGTTRRIPWYNESQLTLQVKVAIHRSFETEREGLSVEVIPSCPAISSANTPDAQHHRIPSLA